MFKKSAVIAAAVALLLVLLLGRSHLKTAWSEVRDTVKNNVSLEYQLKHARQMIKDLTPEIKENLRKIAQEEVEVDNLQAQVEKAEEQLAKDGAYILRLKEELDCGDESFVFSGKRYTAKQVKAKLASSFDQFRTMELTNESLKKVLAARQAGLQAAREKLDAMLDARRQLLVDVENLEARKTMVEVAQASSDFNFDDSQLARTRELIQEIGTRIEVAERLVNVNAEYLDRITFDEEDSADRDISLEVAEYFETSLPEIEAYVKANQ